MTDINLPETSDSLPPFEDTTILTWEMEITASFIKYLLKRPLNEGTNSWENKYPTTLCEFILFSTGDCKVDLRRQVTYELFQTIADDLIVIEEHAHQIFFGPEDESKFDYGPEVA